MLIKVTDFFVKERSFYINKYCILSMFRNKDNNTKYENTYIKTSHDEFNVLETPEEIINQIKGN